MPVQRAVSGRRLFVVRVREEAVAAQILADGVRFELTVGVNPRRFSRPVP